MIDQALEIFKRKLFDELKVVDDEALSHGRNLWKDIDSTPNCPHVKNVMTEMKKGFAKAHQSREKTALHLVEETIDAYKQLISPRLTEGLVGIVEKAFPHDHYVKFAKNTHNVYIRLAIGQENKFDEKTLSIEVSLVNASSSHMANKTILRVRTLLDEALLKKKIETPPWYYRLTLNLWKFFAAPIFKWIFGILAVVLITVIIKLLGFK